MIAALVPLLLVATFAPSAAAQDGPVEQTIYLHETLHIVPERINVVQGDTIQARVINAGTTPHDVLFCGDGVNEQSTCKDRWAFVRLEGGQETNITVPVKKAGTFEYYCSIPGHKQGGMRGELIVQGTADERKVPAPALAGLATVLAVVAFAIRRRK